MNDEIEYLKNFRSFGWVVAIHNDYRQNGEAHTFWLFTHPNGRYIKGEGKTDLDALKICQREREKILFQDNYDEKINPFDVLDAWISFRYYERLQHGSLHFDPYGDLVTLIKKLRNAPQEVIDVGEKEGWWRKK